jgi:hypothetical protein
MGLFGKKAPSVSPINGGGDAPEPTAQDFGVIIHVMPKDFFGGEATLRTVEVPPESKPVVVAPPVVVPPPVPVQIVAPKRRVPVMVWVLVVFLFLTAAGAVVYVMVLKAQEQVKTVETATIQTLPKTDPVVTTPVKTPVVETPKTPELSKDSDSDGLTDIEERMYGTDYRNPDTDGDTFLDGNEVFHRYDPMGLAPSTLLDTGAVKVFADATLPFTVYYPVSWKASVNTGKNTVTFQTPNVAAMIVTWGAKETDLTLQDWILKNVVGADITTLQPSYTKEGYYTLRSKDDLIAYIDAGATVYVLTYDLGTSLDISYTQTFAMIVNSLTIAP